MSAIVINEAVVIATHIRMTYRMPANIEDIAKLLRKGYDRAQIIAGYTVRPIDPAIPFGFRR